MKNIKVRLLIIVGVVVLSIIGFFLYLNVESVENRRHA